jgi:hypothetical protein
MATEWSLGYDYLGEAQTVPSVDESIIERTLRRLEQPETAVCGLTHESHQFMVCHGGPDKFIVKCVRAIAPGVHGAPGSVPKGIFLLGRKNDTNNRVLQVRWRTKPVVLVDVRAYSVLSLSEAITIFSTFFTSLTVHQDFTTIPKPLNGYLT